MSHEDNVKFLKSAIALGEVEKDAAKKCLKVLKGEPTASAADVAERLGLLSASGRQRVEARVVRRKKRKRSKSSAERAALKKKKRASEPVNLESGVLDSDSDERSISESDENKVTQRTPVAKAPEPSTKTPVSTEAAGPDTRTPVTTEAATETDEVESVSARLSQTEDVGDVPPRRRIPVHTILLFSISAVAGTLAGVGGGVAYARSTPERETAQVPPIVIKKSAPRIDPDVIDLSEDDGLAPDEIPSGPGTETMVRRPKASEAPVQPPKTEKKKKKKKPVKQAPKPVPVAKAPEEAKKKAVEGVKTRAREIEKPTISAETALLYMVFMAFDREQKKQLKKLEGQLKELNADGLERHAATGFSEFLQGDFAKAIVELEASRSITGARGRLALARAYMNDGQHKKALGELRAEDKKHPIGKRIVTIVEGPFRAKYPNAADALEAITPDGRYRVVSDLGLSTAYLAELEGDLKGADEKARKRILAKARKKHLGLREVCDTMDKAYKAYDKTFNVKRKGEVVPTVYVFSQRALFDGYSKALEMGATEHTLGYYVGYYRILVFYDRTKPGVKKKPGQRMLSQATLEVLLHETFHQWLDLYCDAPRWFDEGLGEYFGISEMTKTELHYGQLPKRHPSRLSNIRDALRGQGESPLSLEEMIQAPRSVFYGEKKFINYAQAWSFVHFLANNKAGKKLLREYFKAMREGKSLPKAFEDVFGHLDMGKLEDQWRAYVFSLKG